MMCLQIERGTPVTFSDLQILTAFVVSPVWWVDFIVSDIDAVTHTQQLTALRSSHVTARRTHLTLRCQ